MKFGSIQKKIISLTHNKIVLYILLAFALFNLMSYLGQNNLGAIVLFLIIGFGSTCYTKNMVLVLLMAIFATSLLLNMGFLKLFVMREGFDDKSNDDTTNNGMGSSTNNGMGSSSNNGMGSSSNNGMGSSSNNGMGSSSNNGMGSSNPPGDVANLARNVNSGAGSNMNPLTPAPVPDMSQMSSQVDKIGVETDKLKTKTAEAQSTTNALADLVNQAKQLMARVSTTSS